MTSSGILFLFLTGRDAPAGLVARYFFCLLPLRGFDREEVLRLEVLLKRRCVIGFLRNISRAIFQIAGGERRFDFIGCVWLGLRVLWIGYRVVLVPRSPTIRTVVRTRGRGLH